MQIIRDSIYAKYEADSTLVASLSGGLHYDEAPQLNSENTYDAFPYSVFFFVNRRPEYTFTELAEDMIVQFNSYDNSDLADTLEDMQEDLQSCFDLASLTVTGYDHIFMVREFTTPARRTDDIWQITTQYRIYIDKTR